MGECCLRSILYMISAIFMTEGNAKVIKSGDSPTEMSRDESPVTVTAIFDIGKTNKKFLLFDQDFRVVFRQIITLEPAVDDDGDPCEDLDRLTDWIHQMLDKISRDHRFNIRHLNLDRKSTRLNSSHVAISYAVFCLKKKRKLP